MHILYFQIFHPVHRWVHMIYYQWLHHSFCSYIMLKNDCQRRMCVVCIIWKHRNRQYRCIHKHHHRLPGVFQKHPFLSINVYYRWNGHYRWYTFAFFNSFMCVYLTLLGGHCLYNSNLSKKNLILRASLIISSWRHDLICDGPSASRYSEPFRYTKPVALCFLP